MVFQFHKKIHFGGIKTQYSKILCKLWLQAFSENFSNLADCAKKVGVIQLLKVGPVSFLLIWNYIWTCCLTFQRCIITRNEHLFRSAMLSLAEYFVGHMIKELWHLWEKVQSQMKVFEYSEESFIYGTPYANRYNSYW